MTSTPSGKTDSYLLGICGILIAAAGLYFLVIDPGETTQFGQNVANLHKMILGQTLTIAGTILIAVQWRPR